MTDNNSDTETESTEDDEVEPKFKYVRITNDLQTLLNTDIVTCAAVHPRFLIFGTFRGRVYLLDHQGNLVQGSFLNEENKFFHSVAVNHISIDNKGEYIATCSDDGKVVVTGLYTSENNQELVLPKAVKSVALDPDMKSGPGKKFIVGDDNLTLYEKTFLKSSKATVLSKAGSNISSIAWSNQFIAWSCNLGVRVYDLNEKCSLGFMKWEEPKNVKLENFRCNLKWSDQTTLLIGWVDTIRICVIRKRTLMDVSTLPGFIFDPISTFQTNFYVCGLAPLQANQLVALGYSKDKDENDKALRPILCVLQYRTSDYEEICTDSLSLRGYAEYKANDYCLDYIPEENRYFIIAPKDIVVASLYETDDRIKWLVGNCKFEEAVYVLSTNPSEKYSILSVSRLYIDHLLSIKKYDEAAKLCLQVLGNNKVLWEEEVYKFVKVQQLRSVSAYLPRTNECKLDPQVYEMVLFEYLKMDPKGFLNLIKEWQPTLYNTTAVINAIHDYFSKKSANELLEALAILYSHEKKYDNALTMYLKLQNKDVFELIRTHNLYSVIHQMIIQLIELDSKKAIKMLLEKNKIPSEIVVQQLEQRQDFMHLYLDELDKVDGSGKFHWKLVNLYAKYDRSKLLHFLRRSNRYPIQEALDICKRELFYPEMVYLLGRMGNTKEALNILMHELEDIDKAIDFCKEHNDGDLWNNLINESLDKPDIMTKLLDNIVGYVNPEAFVKQIKLGQDIPGLKKSLIKMLCDYSLQVSIQDGCNQILVTDYFNLHKKLIQNNRRAIHITDGVYCGKCLYQIVLKDSQKVDIVVFNCRHYFHESCVRENLDNCFVCTSEK